MADSGCPHGFPKPANCFTCMEDGNLPPPPPPAPVTREGPFFRAKYPGKCSDCDLAIHEEQAIALMSDGTYQHVGCIVGHDRERDEWSTAERPGQ